MKHYLLPFIAALILAWILWTAWVAIGSRIMQVESAMEDGVYFDESHGFDGGMMYGMDVIYTAVPSCVIWYIVDRAIRDER